MGEEIQKVWTTSDSLGYTICELGSTIGGSPGTVLASYLVRAGHRGLRLW